jgi:glycosyltransferase involved in cell wall biosynthesis
MAVGALKILLLGGPLDGDGSGCPLTPLLNRLEKRGLQLQALRVVKGRDLQNDPRVVDSPGLANRWLRSLIARRLWSDGELERPDLVHVVHDGLDDATLALCETAGLPYIQNVSTFGVLDRGLRLSRRWCRRLVADCPELAQDLVARLGVPADAIVVVPPGVDVAPNLDRDARSRGVPVVGTGGPRNEISGLLVFLAAARMVLDTGRDVEFVISGHGNQQAVLRHHSQRLEIADRVTLADHAIVGRDLWTVSDIYCQPSVKPTSGRMLLYALAHGVPCVASSIKGLRSLIVPGETGVIIPVGDAGALAKAMVALLDDPENGRRLARNAVKLAKALFDPDVEADRYAQLYQEVVSLLELPQPWMHHPRQGAAG